MEENIANPVRLAPERSRGHNKKRKTDPGLEKNRGPQADQNVETHPKMRIGVYARELSVAQMGTPTEAAEKAAKYGLAFVPMLCCWQERNSTARRNSKDLKAYAEAFTAAGVEPWIWGYPWAGRENEFLAATEASIESMAGLCRGVILDPELGYQFKSSSEMRARLGAVSLVAGTINLLNESMGLGTTSYGGAHVQARFPWVEFRAGFGSPQFYTAERADMALGLARWGELYTDLIPSIPAYGPNSGLALDAYLRLIGDRVPATSALRGFIAWSWPQMGPVEWSTLARWSRVEQGAR